MKKTKKKEKTYSIKWERHTSCEADVKAKSKREALKKLKDSGWKEDICGLDFEEDDEDTVEFEDEDGYWEAYP